MALAMDGSDLLVLPLLLRAGDGHGQQRPPFAAAAAPGDGLVVGVA